MINRPPKKRRSNTWFRKAGKWVKNKWKQFTGQNFQSDTSFGFGPPAIPSGGNLNIAPSGAFSQTPTPNLVGENPSPSTWDNLKPYIPAAVGAAGNIAGAWINAGSQRSINEQQIQHNMEMYNLTREDAEKMWHMQNEYNTPSAQMDRLREAGLNPHLVYGSGADATASSPETHTAQPARLGVPQSGAALEQIGSYLGNQLLAAQTANVQANTANTEVNTETNEWNIAIQKALGFDRLVNHQKALIATANDRLNKEAMEIENWFRFIATDNQEKQYTIDSRGTRHEPRIDSLLTKQQRSMIEKEVQELELIKKRLVLYNDQHELNKLYQRINDFEASLRNVGISGTTLKGATILLNMVRLIGGSRLR